MADAASRRYPEQGAGTPLLLRLARQPHPGPPTPGWDGGARPAHRAQLRWCPRPRGAYAAGRPTAVGGPIAPDLRRGPALPPAGRGAGEHGAVRDGTARKASTLNHARGRGAGGRPTRPGRRKPRRPRRPHPEGASWNCNTRSSTRMRPARDAPLSRIAARGSGKQLQWSDAKVRSAPTAGKPTRGWPESGRRSAPARHGCRGLTAPPDGGCGR